MTNWRLRDEELKKILHRTDDPDNEERSVAATKAELIPHLKSNPCYHGLSKLTIRKMEKAKTFHTFNQALDDVYDFADENKIWLGFTPV